MAGFGTGGGSDFIGGRTECQTVEAGEVSQDWLKLACKVGGFTASRLCRQPDRAMAAEEMVMSAPSLAAWAGQP